MTVVTWLDEQLQDTMFIQYGYSDGVRKIVIPMEDYIRLKKIAKEMEKEQMFELWNGGINCTEEGGKSFDQYYNEKFKK